ncbi:MAG TPA: protein translocase SEC61 complex subunit gamma [Candidatus Aenigmarchaeota archaeon]|nr:protein translocase SEC61 complex subunit gamma [Candidatus Aenigmarchaeota archaeon]
MGLKNFIKNCVRVLKVTRKPSKEEYFASVKITGLGITLIGLIGFVIFLIFHFLTLFG